jgi:hypothetical protein
VQGYLDRINAFDKQGPNINSVITSIRTRSRKPTGSTPRFARPAWSGRCTGSPSW